MNPIKQITEYGIPVNSYVAAIQYLNDRGELQQSQYENMIRNLTDVDTKFDTQRDARYTFLYLIQETIRESFNTDKLDMKTLLELASKRAKTFIRENPWTWAQAEETPKVDASGNPKRKKGAKQEEAARIYKENKDKDKKVIIELFMSELDMSKAGATTYFYNMKKKFGA